MATEIQNMAFKKYATWSIFFRVPYIVFPNRKGVLVSWAFKIFLPDENLAWIGSLNIFDSMAAKICWFAFFLSLSRRSTSDVGTLMLVMIWAVTWQNQQWLCVQQRLRSVWASSQSDQSLRCPHEATLGPQLSIEHTAKTLIRLGRCPGWFESLLGAHSFC